MSMPWSLFSARIYRTRESDRSALNILSKNHSWYVLPTKTISGEKSFVA